MVKYLLAHAEDTGLSLDLGRSHMTQSNETPEPQLLSPYAVNTDACAPYSS